MVGHKFLAICYAQAFVFVGLAAAPTSEKILIVGTEVTGTSVTLTFPLNAPQDYANYTIRRKLKGEPESAYTQRATGWGTVVVWTDTITPGVAYDYSVTRSRLADPCQYENPDDCWTHLYGSVAIGTEVPSIEQRGKILLVVDHTFVTALAPDLRILESDLVGDGWTVIRRDFARGLPVYDPADLSMERQAAYRQQVLDLKQLIKNEYLADPGNVKAVLLFGHLSVAYSGISGAFDGHGGGCPDPQGSHRGAWPTDLFYAELTSEWTDQLSIPVNPFITGCQASGLPNPSVTTRHENGNAPSDGKWDQGSLPSTVELMIGRVDLSKMPAFANAGETAAATEERLLRQYIHKAHEYRHGMRNNIYPLRGLIDRGFIITNDTHVFADSLWVTFNSLVGANNIDESDFFSTLVTVGYRWAYADGPGGYRGALNVGCTGPADCSPNFVQNSAKVPFLALWGSYFGDWDNSDNFLRAPLANPDTLVSFWNNPYVGFSPRQMTLGETVGYPMFEAQNSSLAIHANLLGDPTLRLHPVIPARNLRLEWSYRAHQVILKWDSSLESPAVGIGAGLIGYNVYRSGNRLGPFVKINATLVTGTSFTDTSPSAPGSYYMVRAVKRELTLSGSYFNLSQGIAVSLIQLRALDFSGNTFQLRIDGPSENVTVETSPDLKPGTWSALSTVSLSTGYASFQETLGTPSTYPHSRFYRVRSGSSLSANSVGLALIVAPPGNSMFASQFYYKANDPSELFEFTTVPPETQVIRYNAGGGYSDSTFITGLGWYADPPITLLPGDGAWFANSGSSDVLVRLCGEVPAGSLSKAIPAGWSMASSIVPQSGIIDVDLAFPPSEGDEIHRYNPDTDSYFYYSYFSGSWWSDEVTPPTARVGESFWIYTPSAKSWTRQFSIGQ